LVIPGKTPRGPKWFARFFYWLGQLPALSRVFGYSQGEVIIVGDFEPQETLQKLNEMLADWMPEKPYSRIENQAFLDVPGGKRPPIRSAGRYDGVRDSRSIRHHQAEIDLRRLVFLKGLHENQPGPGNVAAGKRDASAQP
jgi:hypothetical protein